MQSIPASLEVQDGPRAVRIIDQTRLPHEQVWCTLQTLPEFCHAIASMQVRGAPLIGVTAAFGLALAIAREPDDAAIEFATASLLATRPTAVNLAWALQQLRTTVLPLPPAVRAEAAWRSACELREDDIARCAAIGEHGLALLQDAAPTNRPLQVMTHCNAGSLATIRWGTALAPLYRAHDAGLDIHVWVSETRPRNQGLALTAWELQRAGVPCTVITDNAAGQLMQQQRVDLCLVGSDRTAANGDVCNKIGTYMKALAARAHGLPFYVALPLSTVDWAMASGAGITIEQRAASELLQTSGRDSAGKVSALSVAPDDIRVHNPAFDVTPAALVSGLVTELGVFAADAEGMAALRAAVGE